MDIFDVLYFYSSEFSTDNKPNTLLIVCSGITSKLEMMKTEKFSDFSLDFAKFEMRSVH